MKLIYTDLWGRKHYRQFSSWRELCDFILFNYPIFQTANEFGLIRLLK